MAVKIRTMQPCDAPLPDGGGWVGEPKIDGWRALVRVDAGRVYVRSRHGTELTDRFPELAELAAGPDLLLDGELVVYDRHGRPDFHALAARASPERRAQLAVFDLLEVDGRWLGDQPWERRRARLEHLDLPAVARPVPIGPVDMLWQTTAELGLEGVVAKRLDSRYTPGRRASSWIRAKHWRTTTMRIAGYTVDPAGRLAGLLVTPDSVPGGIIARVELGLHGPPRRLFGEYLPQLRTAANADAVFVEPCVRVAIRHHGDPARPRDPVFAGAVNGQAFSSGSKKA